MCDAQSPYLSFCYTYGPTKLVSCSLKYACGLSQKCPGFFRSFGKCPIAYRKHIGSQEPLPPIHLQHSGTSVSAAGMTWHCGRRVTRGMPSMPGRPYSHAAIKATRPSTQVRLRILKHSVSIFATATVHRSHELIIGPGSPARRRLDRPAAIRGLPKGMPCKQAAFLM